MSVNTRTMAATPERVWEILADGWLYPVWVVGASRMRDVDKNWPEVGSRLHHSVGIWPLLINDDTEVLAATPDRMLRLRARGWPVGEAEIEITIAPVGARTEVVITENVVSGPGKLVPEPLKGLSLAWRNVETLRRLAFIAENKEQ